MVRHLVLGTALLAAGLAAVPVRQLRCQETRVVANKFEIKFHITGTKLRLSIETDLPDDTDVMVGVSRVYTEVGSSARYGVDYFSEKSKIGKWRREHTVEIDNERWKRTLQERQRLLARAGEPFTVANIEDFIEISFIVPVNQENPRFGRRNENLVGSVVTQSGVRVVQDEVRINYPLEGSYDSPVLASPWDLLVGYTYRLSRETPLMPEFEPLDPLAAVARVKPVPVGGTITVREVRVKGGNPWYRVLALSPHAQEIGEGWVNSIALISQEIVTVRR